MFDVGMAAVVLPPVVAVLNQRRWPAPVKGLVALAVCFAYALTVVALRGDVTFHGWRSVALTVSGIALAAYKLWWQPSQIAPIIEDATSVSGAPPDPARPAGR